MMKSANGKHRCFLFLCVKVKMKTYSETHDCSQTLLKWENENSSPDVEQFALVDMALQNPEKYMNLFSLPHI